jgi:hypothetical protein
MQEISSECGSLFDRRPFSVDKDDGAEGGYCSDKSTLQIAASKEIFF